MNSRFQLWCATSAFVFALVACPPYCDSQSPQASQIDAIAAQVGNHSIYESTVLRFLESKFPKRKFQEPALAAIQAHALEHMVHRAIIYQYLVTTGQWVDQSAIRLDIETYEKQLQRADITLDQHLATKKISREQFEFETGWRLSWQKYLDKTLTEANLAGYFAAHRRQFDGTELKVAHLLMRDDSDDTRRELNQIHELLKAKPLEWSNQVAKHSQAPSKDNGGEIGWIGIDGPMPPDFTEAAFKLDVGQFSKPVRTRVGWHIIKCLEMNPGKKGPLDTREELMTSATEFLFFKLAKEHRGKVKIEYSTQFPRLDENGKVIQENVRK